MGIFSKFRKGLKKTRTEGITAQLYDVMESHQEITDDLYDELEEVPIDRTFRWCSNLSWR